MMRRKFYLTLLLLFAAATATAYDFEVDGIYYIVNGNEATVASSPNSNRYFGDVVIPEAVTYEGVTYMVTIIAPSAFYDCRNLTSVVIGNSVTSIGHRAFMYCTGLTSIIVESGNPKYDSRDNCNAIIETASNSLLLGCKNTIIPNSVTCIGKNAFFYCRMDSVSIPNSITSIAGGAFAYSGLTNVNIPNSVTSIGEAAFYSCNSMKCLTLGNSLKSISNNAFYDCWCLTSVTIPRSVTSIGENAFSNCSALTSIIVESGNPKYDSRDNCNAIIEMASNTLITGCRNTIIPNSITSIGEWAFSNCKGLTNVTIPESVKSIRSYAFSHCNSLTSIAIPNSVTSIGDRAFEYCYELSDVYSFITDLSAVLMGERVFYAYNLLDPDIYSRNTLHVPAGMVEVYLANNRWYPYFGTIVEMEPEVTILGDVDGDGKLTVSDVTDLIDKILAGTISIEDYPTADVDNDGLINIADVIALIDYLLSGSWN